jgi:hypothetical protein
MCRWLGVRFNDAKPELYAVHQSGRTIHGNPYRFFFQMKLNQMKRKNTLQKSVY